MAQANKYGLISHFTKANGKMIFQMATVEKSILIETFMKGNGKMEKDMEKEHLKIVME